MWNFETHCCHHNFRIGIVACIRVGRLCKNGTDTVSQNLCVAMITSDEEPTLPELVRLEIPQGVGGNYYTFGILLLNDERGSRMKSFRTECQGKPEDVIQMILEEWLEGKGLLPVTWRSLIKVLNETKLTLMADKIHDYFKNK